MSGHEAFGVDLEALGMAERGIRDAIEQLGPEGMKLLYWHDLGSVGHDGLADALREFRDRWNFPLRELVDDGRAAADALRDTRTQYEKADDQARRALQQAWDELTTPSDPMGNVNTDNGVYSAESVSQGHAAAVQAQQNWDATWEWTDS